MRNIFITLFCLLLNFPAFANQAADIYNFNTPQQQAQFQSLVAELRCLVCQNESLAESNAPLAADLRAEVAQMIQQGASNQQIITYLVNRYGNFVLYRPPLAANTYLLWFAPLILLMLGFGIAGGIIWQRQRQARHSGK